MIAELRNLFLKYRALLLTACGIGVALGLVMARRQHATFIAVGVIQIPGGPVDMSMIEAASAHTPSSAFVSEALTVKDDRTLNRIISELNLADNAIFLRTDVPANPDAEQREELHATALRRLRADLQVDTYREANLLRLSIASRDPRLAAAIINRVIDDFAEGRYKIRYEAAQLAMQFMRPRLDALAARVEQEQTDLLQLQKRMDVPGFNSRRNQLDLARDYLVDDQIHAHLVHIATQIRLNLLRSGAGDISGAPSVPDLSEQIASAQPDANSPAQPMDAGVSTSASLRISIAAAQQQAAMLLATLGNKHPELQAVDARVEALQQSLVAERRNLLATASNENDLSGLLERQFSAELEQRKQRNLELAPAVLQYETEQHDYLFSRALYLRFLWRLHIAAISKSYESADVTVVDRASIHIATPLQPLWKFILRYTLFGFIAGALIMVRIELHFGSARRRLDDLEDLTGLKILSVISKTERLSIAGLIAPVNTDLETGSSHERSQAAYLQSIFDLRAHLQSPFSPLRDGRTILFTSAVPSEGKTTISSSVATIMSRKDCRVLLIDADLRRPRVQRIFRLPGRIGLSTILNGKSTLAEAVQSVPGAANLHILGSGPIPPVATDLTESPQMQQLLAEAAASYDYVIVDSPPVLAVTDSLLLAQMVDAVVWVIKDLKVGQQGLVRTRLLLENAGAPVVGIAVNAMQVAPVEMSNQLFRWPSEFFRRSRRTSSS